MVLYAFEVYLPGTVKNDTQNRSAMKFATGLMGSAQNLAS
jgi:osmotically-inducible protein OsmY